MSHAVRLGAMRRLGVFSFLAVFLAVGSPFDAIRADEAAGPEYDVVWQDPTGLPDLPAAYVGTNAEQGIRTYFTETGIRSVSIAPGKPAWDARLEVVGWGRPGEVEPLGPATHSVSGNRITLLRPGAVGESYVNRPAGLDQSFLLSVPPAGDPGLAHLELALVGLTAKADGNSRFALLSHETGPEVLGYEVSVTDAAGREVPTRLEAFGESPATGLRLILEDTEIAYPLSVAATLVSTGYEPSGEAAVPLAPPPNDLCGGAEVIAGSGPFPFLTAITADITDATTTGDPPTPSCQASISRSIWYSFTPTTSGAYTVSTCADAPTGSTVDDTVLAIYTSSDGTCAGTFTQVSGGCDDDSCTTESLQAVISGISLSAGTTYYVVAWKFGTSAPTVGNTAIQLRVSQAAGPPANDLCGGAEAIPASGPFPYLTAITADITAATSTGDPALPSCQASVSRSIWYTFTPAASGPYEISSCADAPTGSTVDDTVLAVYTSSDGTCGGTLTQLSGACDDDSCASEALQSVVVTNLSSGTPYFILVHKFGTTAPTAGNTAIQLRVNPLVAPSNDSCASPTPLAAEVPLMGTTAVAINDYQLSGAACFTGVVQTASTAPGRDVVYSFTPSISGKYSFRVTGVGVSNPVLYVASSCPAGSPPVTVGSCLAAANRNSSTSPAAEEAMCLTLSAGVPVFVFVDEHVLTSGSGHTVEVNRCVQETEANGTPATANAPACGIEGSIVAAGDVDFYTLGSPLANARIFSMADGLAANSNDFDMRITTSADTLEYDDANLDLPFGSLAPTCDGTKATGAATFVRMSHFSASTQSEPYRLYSVVQPPSGAATAEVESNGTIATANSAANNYFSGVLAGPAPSTDIDIFKVQPQPEPPLPLQPGDLIFVALDADPEFDSICTNARLDLLDASGAILVTVNDAGATSNARTPVAGSLTSTTPVACSEALTYRVKTAGDYYVAVRIGTTSTGTSGAGSYLLSVAVNCVAACDDGNACTTNDNVVGGVCVAGPPTDCDDGNPFTIDTCSPATGCIHTPIECDDGLFCNGSEILDPEEGCLPGTPPDCSDGVDCTLDACDEDADDCTHTADDAACDDSDPCTVDLCDGETGCSNVQAPDPKGFGYYMRLCLPIPAPDALTQADADCVSDSLTFAGVQSVSDLCITLTPLKKLHLTPEDLQCEMAEQQLMSLLLNRCRYRVCDAQAIDSECSDHVTVGESVAHADALLSNPARTFDDCAHAECEAQEINSGAAQGLDNMRVSRAGGGTLRLTWEYENATSSTTYRVYRRVRGELVWTQVDELRGRTFFEEPSLGDGIDYEYTILALGS